VLLIEKSQGTAAAATHKKREKKRTADCRFASAAAGRLYSKRTKNEPYVDLSDQIVALTRDRRSRFGCTRHASKRTPRLTSRPAHRVRSFDQQIFVEVSRLTFFYLNRDPMAVMRAP